MFVVQGKSFRTTKAVLQACAGPSVDDPKLKRSRSVRQSPIELAIAGPALIDEFDGGCAENCIGPGMPIKQIAAALDLHGQARQAFQGEVKNGRFLSRE